MDPLIILVGILIAVAGFLAARKLDRIDHNMSKLFDKLDAQRVEASGVNTKVELIRRDVDELKRSYPVRIVGIKSLDEQ